MKKNIIKHIFNISGTFFLAVGVIGIFVPVLPTTPFLLLSAASYARGSERLYKWLLNNRISGSYVRCYVQGKGMPLNIKLFTLTLLWAGIILAMVFAVEHWAARAALGAIAIGVTIHISLIKPKKIKEN